MNETLLTGLDNTQTDPTKNYLEELVGDGKKFKDNETLARSKFESDNYIKLLEKKLDQLTTDYTSVREENAAKAKLEEMIDKITSQRNASNDNTQINDASKKPEIDLNQIESLFDKKLRESDINRKQTENLNMVKAKLAERFGNHLEDHLKEIGLDGESAAQLAKTNPDLLLKALGADKVNDPGFTPPPRNSSGFTPKPAQKRTWSYYQEMKTKNPRLYFDPKINIQMQKDHIALGAAFEDGDFHN